jgi:hypothetical protein
LPKDLTVPQQQSPVRLRIIVVLSMAFATLPTTVSIIVLAYGEIYVFRNPYTPVLTVAKLVPSLTANLYVPSIFLLIAVCWINHPMFAPDVQRKNLANVTMPITLLIGHMPSM